MGFTEPDSAPVPPARTTQDASSWDIQAPYAPGSPDPIYTGGDDDAGGRDDVAGDVAGAVANAMARQAEHVTDTYGQGSQLGDTVTLPGTVIGNFGGAYYDPPRDYGAGHDDPS